MAVPKPGVYASENKAFTIKIEHANPSNGVIQASYVADYSPEGHLSQEGEIGRYAWVHSDKEGKDGVAPFSIRFICTFRPEGRPYCILDSWTGAYLIGDALLLEGVRSYVSHKGVVEVLSLGTLKFTL